MTATAPGPGEMLIAHDAAKKASQSDHDMACDSAPDRAFENDAGLRRGRPGAATKRTPSRWVYAGMRRLRRATKPSAPRPAIIRANSDGSGTGFAKASASISPSPGENGP